MKSIITAIVLTVAASQANAQTYQDYGYQTRGGFYGGTVYGSNGSVGQYYGNQYGGTITVSPGYSGMPNIPYARGTCFSNGFPMPC